MRSFWPPILLLTSMIALPPPSAHADTGSAMQDTESKFRALEALFFLPRRAFPARDLAMAYPGDLIDIDLGQRLAGRSGPDGINDCLPDLDTYRHEGIYKGTFREDADISGLLAGAGSVGPGGLIDIGGELGAKIRSAAGFNVPALALTEPSAGVNMLLRVDAASDCDAYREVHAGQGQGRVIIASIFDGRLEFRSGFSLATAAAGTVETGILLQLLTTLIGVPLPLGALEISADQVSGSVAWIKKPAREEIPLAFVPMYLNQTEVARLHYYLQGERRRALEEAVREALGSPDPTWREWFGDVMTELLGSELPAEAWARQFLAGGEGAEMVPTDEVISALEEDGGVLESLALYAAALELLDRGSGIAEFNTE